MNDPLPPPGRNRLGDETSPYLRQHRDNPVHWWAWGEAAFAESRRTNRPILLSIGYAACHWCHVMAHESFESDETAALMNRLYVNVKVDREERPDVDQVYQHALALLGEQGGWPLTMFLTPAGEPFWGGTYFPPEDRYGRPGFPRVLARIAEIFAGEGEKVAKNVAALKSGLARLAANAPGGRIPPALIDRACQHFLDNVDGVHGGLAGAPKFPQCSVFQLLWRAGRRTGDEAYRRAVLVTLNRMSDGGLYDHLGGGYARYSTDAQWLVPHFEKMLYDNAQILELLAACWQDTRDPLYAERAAETVAWLAREMRLPGGGFAGTLDADSEGEEGKFYVWTEAEIDGVLGADAPLFKIAYDVTADGNWEGRTILNRNRRPRRADAATEARLAAAREKLLAARGSRIRPGLDDKVLADWNGLMIAALAKAARVFGRPDWIALAEGAWRFVEADMVENGRLLHAWCAGRARHPGTLDDHAALARAALALHEATGRADYLAKAEAWVEAADARFKDAENGGYFLSAADVADVIVRPKSAHDHATPSGNGMMAEVLARLFHLTGNDAYRRRAEAQIAAFAGDLERNALAMPVLLAAQELLENAVQVVVAGPAGAASAALEAAAFQAPAPNLVFQRVADPAALPADHPAKAKAASGGGVVAFVCRGQTCSLPISDPAELARQIAG
jgi:hypothetical protein